MKFKSEQECINHITKIMPHTIQPTRKSKAAFINPFTSLHAFSVCCEVVGKEVYKLLNE